MRLQGGSFVRAGIELKQARSQVYFTADTTSLIVLLLLGKSAELASWQSVGQQSCTKGQTAKFPGCGLSLSPLLILPLGQPPLFNFQTPVKFDIVQSIT